MSKVCQKKEKKVSSNLEGVEKVVWALALLPRWWFVQAATMGVVVAVCR